MQSLERERHLRPRLFEIAWSVASNSGEYSRTVDSRESSLSAIETYSIISSDSAKSDGSCSRNTNVWCASSNMLRSCDDVNARLMSNSAVLRPILLSSLE
jgi:hypothetical protein